MLIPPDSKLYILKDVPLDTTYEHTLWFDIVENKEYGQRIQALSFSGKAKYKLEFGSEYGGSFTYVRVNRNRIKVPFKADDLYDCNYIMFQNTGFGNKWFYAFIKSVEYVNNRTSEITFEIDVMQTWHFDYVIDDCFVEREHSEDDAIYSNTLPENVDLGDYISEGQFGTGAFTDWVIVVVRAVEAGTSVEEIVSFFLSKVATGGFYNGTYQQVEYDIFEPSDTSISAIRDFLNTSAVWKNEDAILGMFLIPRNFMSTPTGNLRNSRQSGLKLSNITVCNTPYTSGKIGEYQPKNNKLYTFPYCFLECANFEGDTKIYKYEYFSNGNAGIGFALFTDTNLKPTVMIAPNNYMSYNDESEYYPNLQESISITNFPQCTYGTTDAGAKFVQNMMGIALGSLSSKTVSGTVNQLYTLETRNPKTNRLNIQKRISLEGTKTPTNNNIGSEVGESLFSGIQSSGISTIIGQGNIYQSATMAHPSFGEGLDFAFRQLHIRPEYARVIDDYFSAFGYATKRLKHPNRSSRPHWNYVKTIGCTITGSVPCDDMATICSIYDSGITFWKNMAEIGDYSLDNSPIL